MPNSKKQSDTKNDKKNQRKGDISRTSSQGRKESSGGGKAKKGNDEVNKNLNARKI